MEIQKQNAASNTDKGLQWLPFGEDDSEETQNQKGTHAVNGAGEVQNVKQEQPDPPQNDCEVRIDDDLIF